MRPKTCAPHASISNVSCGPPRLADDRCRLRSMPAAALPSQRATGNIFENADRSGVPYSHRVQASRSRPDRLCAGHCPSRTRIARRYVHLRSSTQVSNVSNSFAANRIVPRPYLLLYQPRRAPERIQPSQTHGSRLKSCSSRANACWMVGPHLPTFLPTLPISPFGICRSAFRRQFIFLSALFTGLIFFRLASATAYAAMRQQNPCCETLRLYSFHACSSRSPSWPVPAPRAAITRIFTICWITISRWPKQAIPEAFLLIYRPRFWTISADCTSFPAMTPVVLTITRRVGWARFWPGSPPRGFWLTLGVL